MPSPLTQWRTAVANRSTTAARVVFCGDSITENSNASTQSNAWADRTLAALRTAYPTTGGDTQRNFLPPHNVSGAVGEPYTSRTGTITEPFGQGHISWKNAAMAAGATQVYTLTGPATVYARHRTGGGSYTIRVDAGAATTVNTATVGTGVGRSPGLAVAAGSHTVTITATTAVTFSGLDVLGATVGIQGWVCGHHGIAANDYVGYNPTEGDRWQAALNETAPDLVTVWLGYNDYIGDVSDPKAPSMLTVNLRRIITRLRALTKVPSILLIGGYHIDYEWPTTGGFFWAPYGEGQRAASDPGVEFLNLNALMPAAMRVGTHPYYNADAVHPTDSGHARISELVVERLTRVDPTGMLQLEA